MLKLAFTVNGEDRIEELKNGSLIVGRGKACDIVMKEASVSSQHVRFDVGSGQVRFRDLLSSNGTFLNGKKVQEGVFTSADTLRLGKISLRLSGGVPAPDAFDMGSDSETPPQGVAAVAPPPSYDVVDETPAGGSFVPAVVASTPMAPQAVEVVRPDEEAQLPAVIEKTGAGPTQKQKLLWAGITAVVVLALGILMLPSSQQSNKHKAQSLDYWGSVREGEEAFRIGEFEKAYRVWHDIDQKWAEQYESGPEAARHLALAAKALGDGLKGSFERTGWREIAERLKDSAAYGNEWPMDRQEFAFQVAERLQAEVSPKGMYFEAERLFESGAYEEAAKKYAGIPSQSVYHQIVAKRVAACNAARFKKIKEAALMAGKLMRWSEALEAGRKALAMQDDVALRTRIGIWEKNARQETLMRQFRRAIQGRNWASARQVLPQIDRQNSAAVGLDPLVQDMERGLFGELVQQAYNTWDLPRLGELKQNKRADKPENAALFAKMNDLLKEKKEAEEALRVDDPFSAIDHWRAIRRLEPQEAHPMNSYARGKMESLTMEDIGAKLVLGATKAFHEGKYRKGRLDLQKAANKCNVTGAEEIKLFQERGRKLYNEAVNLIHQNRFMEAKIKMGQARDCFLPGEKWYLTVDNRYRKEFGE